MIWTRWGIFLLILALVPRIGAAIAIGDGFHFADEANYVDVARRLSAGAGFGPEYSGVPAYPAFLALLSLGLPTGVGLLRVMQAAVAATGSVLVYALARRAFGHRAAVPAALIYALDPLLVITSGLLYPETVAAVLLIIVVLLALDGPERDRLARSAVTGALLGLLALLRPVALVLPPIVAAWVAVTVTARLGRRLAHVAALGLAFALVLSPWIVRNYRVRRELVPVTIQGSYTAPIGRSDIARRGLLGSLAHWAWNHPEAMVARLTRQFGQFWELAPTRMVTDDPFRRRELHERDPRLEVQPLFPRRTRDLVSAASFTLELVLALVGITVAVRAHRRPALLILGVIFAWAMGYALFVAKLRYRIPILPLLFLFTGAGAAAAQSLMRRAAARDHHFPGS